jgi:hypothetical protein
VQSLTVAHDTPSEYVLAPAGCGIFTSFQLDPDQRSASGCGLGSVLDS